MAYHPPIFPNTYMRSSLPYQVSYHPPFYHPYPTHFDPSVSLANPYIYDPTQVKHRRRTTPEQLKVLEDTFKTDPKPSPALRRQLSTQLGMSPRVLQVSGIPSFPMNQYSPSPGLVSKQVHTSSLLIVPIRTYLFPDE